MQSLGVWSLCSVRVSLLFVEWSLFIFGHFDVHDSDDAMRKQSVLNTKYVRRESDTRSSTFDAYLVQQ